MSRELRPPTEDDVPTVVRLMSEHWPEPADEELVRRGWASPTLELERDARLEEGAYAVVSDLGDGRAWIDLRGSPSPAMLDWAEARAFVPRSRGRHARGLRDLPFTSRARGPGMDTAPRRTPVVAKPGPRPRLAPEGVRGFPAAGFARAGLGVDAESVTGANRLYEQAGMHVSARFDVYEKRAG